MAGAPGFDARRASLLALAALAWYAMGINPWVAPGHYDSLLYHEMATSLAQGRGPLYAGELMRDWPPLFPALLSIPRWWGASSLLSDKFVVLLTVPIVVMLMTRLLHVEKRPHVTLTVVLVVLSPLAFRYGTAAMAEWPYMLASFAFLLGLASLTERASVSHSIGLGLLLGAAALTRYTGVFLGASVVMAGLQRYRRAQAPRLRLLLPEAIVAFVGGAIFLSWQLYLKYSALPSDPGINLSEQAYSAAHPFEVAKSISNVLWASHSLQRRLPLPLSPLSPVLLVPAVLALAGLAIRFLRGRASPSDGYLIALLVFLSFYEEGGISSHSRYLLPVSPFLVSACIDAVDEIKKRVRFPPHLLKSVAVAWASLLFFGSMVLLLHGTKSHAGLAYPLSTSADDFYRGYFQHVYQSATRLKRPEVPGVVVLLGQREAKFVRYFSGREVTSDSSHPAAVFLLAGGTERPENRWLQVAEHGRIRTYRARAAPADFAPAGANFEGEHPAPLTQ